MRVLLGEHWWLKSCWKGLWGGVLLQPYRPCSLSGQLIRQQGLLQASSHAMVSSSVDQQGTSAVSPRRPAGSDE